MSDLNIVEFVVTVLDGGTGSGQPSVVFLKKKHVCVINLSPPPSRVGKASLRISTLHQFG